MVLVGPRWFSIHLVISRYISLTLYTAGDPPAEEYDNRNTTRGTVYENESALEYGKVNERMIIDIVFDRNSIVSDRTVLCIQLQRKTRNEPYLMPYTN